MVETLILIALLAFVLTFIDVSFGMGFSIMAPTLIILNFSPKEVIPAVLFCSVLFGILGGISHHKHKNVNFGKKTKSLKIMLIVSAIGIVGILAGAMLAINLPENITKFYIAGLMIVLGLILLIKHKKEKHTFSWAKTLSFGVIASFNKGIAGGGYGPVLTGGQILSGVDSKKAIAITTLSEGLISIAGVITFFIFGGVKVFNWSLIIALTVGGLISIPIATFTVKKMRHHHIKVLIGLASILLGIGVLFTTPTLA
ncbi:MAG: sulfite exporter TauE/SafE family protein [Nitrospirota bacterium]